jgi:hypothetical protein
MARNEFLNEEAFASYFSVPEDKEGNNGTKLDKKKKDTKRMIFEGVAAMTDTDLLRETANAMDK